MKVGDGLEPDVEIGALIDEDAITKADAACRGRRPKRRRAPALRWQTVSTGKGFFFEPTVLADVPPTALCMHEETFAPIAAITPFDTEAEGIDAANGSPFGLSAYAFTRDLSRTFRLMESLEAGIIGINDGVPTTTQAPFGGVKQSGWGRELGIEGHGRFSGNQAHFTRLLT